MARWIGFVLILFCIHELNGQCVINTTMMNEIIRNLEFEGYVVEKGHIHWYEQNQTAYLANPTFNYGFYDFKRPGIPINITHYLENNITRMHAHLNEFWFMEGSSAVFWHGCVPPTYYYSYRTYLNHRFNPYEHPYSSLGSMLNHMFWNQSSDGLTTVISTPDSITFNNIYDQFKKYNMTNTVNLDYIPSQIPDYNLTINFMNDDGIEQLLNNQTLDSFTVMLRCGLPKVNAQMLHKYLAQNQTIYKIYHSNHTSNKPRKPYNIPFFLNATTGIYEQNIVGNAFVDYYQNIIAYTTDQTQGLKWNYISTKVSASGYKDDRNYGPSCIKFDTRCIADNQDANYFVSWPDVSVLNNHDIWFIVGVIHADLNKSRWDNIAPYFEMAGIGNRFYESNKLVMLNDNYRNSSLSFPPKEYMKNKINLNILNKFFVIAAMRPEMCDKYFNNPQNYPQLISMPKFCFTNQTFPSDIRKQNWFIVQRSYVNNRTLTRPLSKELIPFVILQFNTV
eukprot:42469_1